MSQKPINILLFTCTIFSGNLFSQVPVQITRPTVDFIYNKLTINYDIENCSSTDHFCVWLEITNRSGIILEPKSLSGDVGENIRGGMGKQIIWDLGKDNFKINEELFVQVKAEKMVKDFKKGQALLLSAAVPGLGQSVIYKGKPVWIIGIAAYGCLASSVVLNRSAYNFLENYKNEEIPQERDDLYNQVLKRDKISKMLAYTAGGIWLANIFWVAVAPNRYHRPSEEKTISLFPSYNIYVNKPQISISYRF